MNKKYIVAAGIIATSLFLAGCAKKDTTDYISQGYEQLNNMEYVTAMQSFKSAVDSQQSLTEAYRGLGICYMSHGEYEMAVESFKNALAESGSTPQDIDFDINYYIGVCYHKLGMNEEAKERYDAILALRPKDVDAYMQRGTEYLYLKDPDAACADFDKALSLKKKDYSLYIDIYNILAETGYQQKGTDYLNKALNENDRKMSDYDKGYIYYCLGNYSSAKKCLEDARTDEKRGNEALLLLGQCYEKLNDTDFSINIYSKYLETNPDAGVYNQLAVALMSKERYEEALEAIVNGLEVDSNECRQQLLYNRIVVYEYLGDYSKAYELATQYIVDYPSDESMAREILFLKTR